jgi:hypothetical protein
MEIIKITDHLIEWVFIAILFRKGIKKTGGIQQRNIPPVQLC